MVQNTHHGWLPNDVRQALCKGMMMIFPVEIKVNVDGAVDDARSRLGGPQGALSRRRIWFVEDRNGVEHGKPSLIHDGVIIRFRSGDEDDLTAKLRPCRESQLVHGWSCPFETDSFKYRIEGDWSGKRRELAASAGGIRPPESLSKALGGGVG